MPSHFDPEYVFKYHAPNEDQQIKYVAIRESAKSLAKILQYHCPESADLNAALRLLRECVMTANASVALGGVFNKG